MIFYDFRGVIGEFKGDYSFLSNFYPAKIRLIDEQGRVTEYKTSEHAYQAAKTVTNKEHDFVNAAETAGEAKKRGKMIELRPKWDKVKIPVMEEVCYQKFVQHPNLLKKLLATNDAELIEGNNWGDKFWGQVNGFGRNELGKILMRLRKKFKERGVQ